MITRRFAAIAVAAVLLRGSGNRPGQAAAAAHRRRRHLRAARHAQAGRRRRGLPDRPLHRGRPAHEARDHHRRGELLDADPGHAVRPLRLHRRADDGDQGARGEHAVHRGLSVDRLPVRHQEGLGADQGLGRPQGQGRCPSTRARPTRRCPRPDGRASTASPCRSTTPSPTPRRPCSRAAPTPRSAATPRSSTPRRKNPQFVADLELKDTRAHWAAPVPQEQRRSCAPSCRMRSTA